MATIAAKHHVISHHNISFIAAWVLIYSYCFFTEKKTLMQNYLGCHLMWRKIMTCTFKLEFHSQFVKRTFEIEKSIFHAFRKLGLVHFFNQFMTFCLHFKNHFSIWNAPSIRILLCKEESELKEFIPKRWFFYADYCGLHCKIIQNDALLSQRNSFSDILNTKVITHISFISIHFTIDE